MNYIRDCRVLAAVVLVAAVCEVMAVVSRQPPAERAVVDAFPQDTRRSPTPDLSGRKRTGTASFYAEKFTGRKMADGTRMDPNDDNAASRTLPLGTTAKVTNLETGQSAVVTIQDRGPYVKGRIIDLSPARARVKSGSIDKMGSPRSVVAPIEVPLPDGSVKQGAAASDKTR